jgi:single-strand DNA-binding protein
MINKVTLIGNLGKDPEVRTFDNGSKVARFSLATNESYQDKAGEWQTNTEWHNVVCWRGLADRAERQLKKGSLVYVEGKITYRKWSDSEGKERYSTDIVAAIFRSLDRNSSGGASNYNLPSADDEPGYLSGGQSTSQEPVKTLATDPPKSYEDTPMEDDDLPF